MAPALITLYFSKLWTAFSSSSPPTPLVKPEREPESPTVLAETQPPGPAPRVSDLTDSGCSLRNPISNTFPGTAAAGLGSTLRITVLYHSFSSVSPSLSDPYFVLHNMPLFPEQYNTVTSYILACYICFLHALSPPIGKCLLTLPVQCS